MSIECNDIHSRLNRTLVSAIAKPSDTEEVAGILSHAAMEGTLVSICGARHAMGGQQFGTNTLLIDLSELRHVELIDHGPGTVEAGAGIQWPDLIDALIAQQPGDDFPLTIRQKQTGANDMTLGGGLSANIHGRGLAMRPLIDDVEAFTLVDAGGSIHRCSRSENAELFRLVIGGYGCFGVITSVCLRLVRRHKLIRSVEMLGLDRLMDAFNEKIADGYLFGDFQFSIDETSADFLHHGVFSCYRAAPQETIISDEPSPFGWQALGNLIRLAHTDRKKGFEMYSEFYLKTDGVAYWSDLHQMSLYQDGYHLSLDEDLHAECAGSEMISELYVPHDRLEEFMERSAKELRKHGAPLIYGTVRLIRRDEESFLAWAKQDLACVIFNLHTEHHPAGIERSAAAFRALYDISLSLDGSFYLTYHRWATAEQLLSAYPQLPEFLRLKERHDPAGRFQSDWWRHLAAIIPHRSLLPDDGI